MLDKWKGRRNGKNGMRYQVYVRYLIRAVSRSFWLELRVPLEY